MCFEAACSLSYWERYIPWTFNDLKERPSFQERRRLRYDLQDYMHEIIFSENMKGKELLEVGCGSGIDAVEFASLGAIVTATDSSDLAMQETTKTIQESNCPKITLKKADAESLPFPEQWFDFVYCFGVLHHLENPLAALLEIRRVLKPSGSFICMLYNTNSILNAYSIHLLGLSFERKGNPYTTTYTDAEAIDLFGEAFMFSGRPISVVSRFNVVDLPDKRKVKLGIPDELGLGWHLIIKVRAER